MYSGNMWSSHHGYSYGKRSAEAEPQGISGFPRNSGMGGGYWTPSMEALLNPEYTQKLEVFSQQYTNAVANLKVDMDYSKNLDAITRQYNNDVAALNSYNWHKYGKRSAEAEAQQNFPNSGFPGSNGMGGGYWTPSLEALLNPEYTQKLEAFSQQYANAVANLKVDMDYSKNLDAITRQYNNDVAALNSYNWHKYGKRSAEAEPEADAWFGPYGYSYNMNFMNRPYNYYGYRYYF